jgi:N-formylglutamate deformylase
VALMSEGRNKFGPVPNSAVTVKQGNSPVILAAPHVGTWIPEEIFEKLNDTGRKLEDTDWHVDQLYEDLLSNATMVCATFHRYVIDANRDPSGQSLYPGQNTTSLVPTTDFNGNKIWLAGKEPSEAEIIARLASYHAPYHEHLGTEIRRLLQLHGKVVLFDCHSIRSEIPFLFDGVLPDLNFGTNEGRSCSPVLRRAIEDLVQSASANGYRCVIDGRFKGGWTTRHYSDLETQVHTVQLELAQSTYLEAEDQPFTYSKAKAEKLRPYLRNLLFRFEELALNHLSNYGVN